MAIQTLIVDDEPLARARLARLLSTIPDVEVVAICDNGQQAVDHYTQHKPDLVLMDIQMPVKTGIEAAAEIMQLAENPPSIIFCTAYDEYALKAFQLSAAAYLLKPISGQQLQQAVAEATKLTQLQINVLAEQTSSKQSLIISHSNQAERVDFDDICYFRSEAKNVLAGLSNGSEIVVEQTLTQLEQKFKAHLLRLHRSTLVNRAKLQRLSRDSDGNDVVELVGCDQAFTVSRRLSSNVRHAFSSIK